MSPAVADDHLHPENQPSPPENQPSPPENQPDPEGIVVVVVGAVVVVGVVVATVVGVVVATVVGVVVMVGTVVVVKGASDPVPVVGGVYPTDSWHPADPTPKPARTTMGARLLHGFRMTDPFQCVKRAQPERLSPCHLEDS